MPKVVTEFTVSALKSILKTVHHYGITFFISVIVILMIAGSIAGYIAFPWDKIKADVSTELKAHGKEIIDAIGQQHADFMTNQADTLGDIAKASIESCKIIARSNHSNEADCVR